MATEKDYNHNFRKNTLRECPDAVALLQDIRDNKAARVKRPLDLANVLLVDADLEGVDLSGADLSGSDLTGANLKGAKLFKANLTHANLDRAILEEAELSGADLTDANLEAVRGKHAGFGMAKLTGANLFQADLGGATLTMADLTGAQLQCCRLREARMREVAIIAADLTNADLGNADLSQSRVDRSNFSNADLRGAILRQVSGYETADWIGVDIRDINFSGAYLMRRFIMDQNYIAEFKERSRLTKTWYYLWLVASDCGRSLIRWCIFSALLVALFGFLYMGTAVDYGDYRTWFSPFYYSLVTFTTLGYGDVIPAGTTAQVLVIAEVVIGYIMLGGLLSIFANKMARRAD